MAEPASFDEALQALAEELGREQPTARRALDRPRVRAGELPYMPRRPSPEVRSSLSPEVDFAMNALGVPPEAGPALDAAYRIGEWGPRQMQRAQGAIGRAIDEPSIGNIANAGTQSGMALMRPAIALPSLALQYGNAAADDLDLFKASSAQAQAKSKAPPAPKPAMPGLTADQQQLYDAASKRLTNQDYSSAAERRQLEQTMQELRTLSNNIQLNKAGSQQKIEETSALKDREEFDRGVKRAEDVRDAELAKRKTFKDTAVGKVWEETGGAAPFLVGVGTGFIRRGINPELTLPAAATSGAIGGAAASNLPLGADAYLVPPVQNPDKRAFEGYARELPPTHPRKAEFADYAKGLPQYNPDRSEAERQLYDPGPAIKRNIYGAAEGAIGSELGYGLWHIPARLLNALGGSRGSPSAGQPVPSNGGPSSGSGGQGTSGTPPVTLVPEETAGLARNGLANGQTQRQLPSPEASPSQSRLYAPEELPIRERLPNGTVVHRKPPGTEGAGRFTDNPRKKSIDE